VTDRGNKGEGGIETRPENAAANGTSESQIISDFWAGKQELLGSSGSFCLSEGCCVNEKEFGLRKSD